jgi:hypothetical protein
MFVKNTVADLKGFRCLPALDTDGGGDGNGGDEHGGGDGGGSERDEGGGQGGGSGRGGRSGVKRKRKDENEDDESRYGTGAMSGPGSDRRSGNHVTPDACPREGRA